MNLWKRLCAWLDDYQAALEEVAELRDSVVRAQQAAHMHATNAQRAKANGEAWEKVARGLRADLLGREAEDYLIRQRCDALVHRVHELERRAHPSNGDDR